MKTLTRRLWIVLLMPLLLTPAARAAERIAREFDEYDFGPAFSLMTPDNGYGKDVGRDGIGRYKDGAGRVCVRVAEPAKDGNRTVTLLTLDAPPVTQNLYYLAGTVEYENVEGKAYLEMWSDFADGGHDFSRTLGDEGPMMAISGTSAKRRFMLPFTSKAGQTPSKLTVNVVMPGRGKVTLGRLRLTEWVEPSTAPTLEERMRERRDRAWQQSGLSTTGPAGPTNDLNTLDGEVLALRDPLKPPRTASGAQAAPPPNATQAFRSWGGPDPLSAAGLPPEAAAEVRKQLAGELVAWLRVRSDVRQKLDEQRGRLGANHADVLRGEQYLQLLDRRIDAVKTAMAEPASPAAPTGLVAWLDRHSAVLFAGLVAVALLAMIPLRLLMKSGRGRAVVLGFFGLMFAGGVGQLFAAGVALGMGRPADAWVTLLGCAAILIVCGGLMLRQARAHYAGFELRKLRAMDVA